MVGLDGGSTSSKAVLMSEAGELLLKSYTLSQGQPDPGRQGPAARSARSRAAPRAPTLEVIGFGATGYAADVLEECVRADVNVVETVAHMMSATHYFGEVDVICDIGGQDIKVLFMENGDIKSFKLSNQCSAGNGMLLQAMADQFGLPVTEYAETAFKATLAPKFNYGCAVFLDTDRVNFQKEGYGKEELLAGLAQVLPKNVWQYVVAVPRLASFGQPLRAARRHAIQPGCGQSPGRLHQAARARTAKCSCTRTAAKPARSARRWRRCAWSSAAARARFIGLDAAIELRYEAINNEETKCTFCPNNCSRTFIDAFRPDGSTSRYISGFSCEKGMVESKEAMLDVVKQRKKLMKSFPNLVAYEARKAFQTVPGVKPLPDSRHADRRRAPGEELLGRVRSASASRAASSARARSDREAQALPHRDAARAQHVVDGAVLPHVLRGARPRPAQRDRSAKRPTKRCGPRAASTARSIRASRRRSCRRTSTSCSFMRTKSTRSTRSSSRSSRTCRRS